MSIRIPFFTLCIITHLLYQPVFGQAPKYSNEFLSIGIDARALGMSNSVIASVSGAPAAYWNPAAMMLKPTNMQLALMHAEYFAGIAKYDYGTVVATMDKTSTAGVSFIRFAVDDIPNTTELIDADGNINYDRIKAFSAVDFAMLLSYAREVGIKNMRLGGSAKIVRRKVGDFAGAWGFGFDLGMQYATGKWKFGVQARDITSTFNAWSFNLDDRMIDVFTLTGNEIPENSLEITMPRLLAGAGRSFRFNKNLSLYSEIGLDITTDGKRNTLVKSGVFSIDPHLGLELSVMDLFFVRGGVGNIQKEYTFDNKQITTLQPNIGAGINIRDKVMVDYALTNLGQTSSALYSNIFSLRINLQGSRKTAE
ncbi:MAG TPA: PorV/PorQ family protein [Bacteroidales bacterium]|nr:PorV/PorQ family protein [Bacteroidales bacterium]HRZ49526.1 PorV/PorQ family protein [Bacteroidales bacterium]